MCYGKFADVGSSHLPTRLPRLTRTHQEREPSLRCPPVGQQLWPKSKSHAVSQMRVRSNKKQQKKPKRILLSCASTDAYNVHVWFVAVHTVVVVVMHIQQESLGAQAKKKWTDNKQINNNSKTTNNEDEDEDDRRWRRDDPNGTTNGIVMVAFGGGAEAILVNGSTRREAHFAAFGGVFFFPPPERKMTHWAREEQENAGSENVLAIFR